MTHNERRLYGRGYNAGVNGRWPEHRPPRPPDENVAAILKAAQELRDGVDGEIAMFDEHDPIAKKLGPLIDALDDELVKVRRWLVSPETA